MNTWYFFPYKCYDAHTNMKIDHSLAQNFHMHNTPILRFFGWEPYTLSIGYNQKEEAFDLERLERESLGVVRRPTGGRAIFHGNELTYSVIHPANIKKTDLYKQIHTAFINGFRELGLTIDLNKSQPNLNTFYKTKESISCFAASAKFEATNNGKKFIGSAQRVYEKAILQHGSIMLFDDFFKVFEYLFLDEKDKRESLNRLKEKTFFWDLDMGNISIQTLCSTLTKHFRIEFNISEMIEEPFNLDTWKYLENV